MARAVHYAHQHGILHRDLKPANILLDEMGQPLVTDFGLAKRVEGDSTITQSGAIVGTPSYMPPEQAAGKKGLSTAVDTYSLGAILYELLTGRPPFRAATALDTLLHVLEREPERPRSLNRQVSRDLETICLKCLNKEPSRRYGSAEMLSEDLERWLRGEPIAARPVSLAEKAVKWVRRRPAIAGLVAAVFLVTILGIGAFAWSFDQTVEARDKAVAALQETEKARQQAEGDRKKAEDHQQIAEKARQQADVARSQKEKQLLRAESLLYAVQIAKAHDSFLSGDLVGCRDSLDECRWDFQGPEYGYLVKRLLRKLRTFFGHTGGVTCLAVSADGKRLLSGGDNTIKVWDLVSGKEILTLAGTRARSTAWP